MFLVDRLNYGNLSPTHNIFSRRLATVLIDHSNAWLISMLGKRGFHYGAFKQTCCFDENVGAQLPTPVTHRNPYRNQEGYELEQRGDTCYTGYFIAQTPSVEPSIAPLLLPIGSVCVGFVSSLFGLLNLNYERSLLGAPLLRCWLLGAGGFLMRAMPL